MVFFLIAKLEAPKTPSRDLPEHLVIPPPCFKQYTLTECASSLSKDEKTQVEPNVRVIGVLAVGVVYACRGAGTRRGLYIEARTLERKGELCWSFAHNTCPYVQRTRMVLAHKGVPFELIEIDLGNKPDWFLEISLYGKVPDLKVGDAVLCELAIISEYLDEVYPENRLLSEDPLERASQRSLIKYVSNKFVPLFCKLLLAQEEAQEGYKEKLLAHFDYFESLLRDRTWL